MELPYNINHAVGLLPGHPSVPSVNVLPLQRSIPSCQQQATCTELWMGHNFGANIIPYPPGFGLMVFSTTAKWLNHN